MEILWTAEAKRDLRQIYQLFATAKSAKTALKEVNIIRAHVRGLTPSLANNAPLQDGLDLEALYRYLIVGHYKIIFRTIEEKALLVSVFDIRHDPIQ